ncbi:MAG: NAD(P)H-dependent oxidoreductase [Cyanobacteriota bacterium]
MTYNAKILAFAGSTRKSSYNKKLSKIAAQAARKEGAIVTYIDLNDYPLPLYDEDIETKNGIPENALKLKQLFNETDGFIISSPEYNSSISGVLKNTIDWVSRPVKNEPVLSGFKNKIAVILSASPGNLGGLRGLSQLRHVLNNLYVIVLPEQITISNADKAFNDTDQLIDAKKQEAIELLGKNLTTTINKLNR